MNQAIRCEPASSPTAPVAIECRQATVEFDGGTRAVESVDLSIRRGERLAIVGQSGCGKTTLLRAIASLQPLAGGEILIRDPESDGFSGATSFVFQQPALLPWRRIIDNVTLPLELDRSLGKWADRLDSAMRALSEVELSAAARQFPHELSGGMQMRVSIARALVTGPKRLLLDEPFAALDDLLRTQLGDLVTHLWRTHGFTMLLVTHNIAEAIELSDRICVMHAGRIEEVLENPLRTEMRSAGEAGDVRRTSQFGEFYGLVSDRLREAADASD